MKDKLYIKSRLNTLTIERVPIADEYIIPRDARISIVSWIYNNGDLRPESTILIQKQNLEEELIALDFANDTSMTRKIAEAKLEEINCILN